MSSRKVSAAIALGSALVFSLLCLLPFFDSADAKIYDAFLRFAPRRARIDSVVFLDVDDRAIAKVGVFPWPRRIMAEGLLWLKECKARLAVFDIEYIDKSPTQVDEIYLREGLAQDYNRRFSEIGTAMADILAAVGAGYIPREKAPLYIDEVTELIAAERDALFRDTMKISGDDDLLLARAAALFGRAWGTVNLQDKRPLSGEQAERRPEAERRFSYAVKNENGMAEGKNIDVLPPIPLFMEAVRGAGFTNITVDPDGVRRRIFLAQEVGGHWYLQLAFAPLMASWGSPAITIQPRRFVIEKPGERDLVIPLDAQGAMLLDWPPESYEDSFSHVSFVQFALLEEYQTHIRQYLSALEYCNKNLFPLLARTAGALLQYYNAALAAKNEALENCSDTAFAEYVSLRDEALQLTGEFTAALAAQRYIEDQSNKALAGLASGDPAARAAVLEEAGYCQSLIDYVDTELNAFAVVRRELRTKLDDKMCVIGRVDTGTTDIGVTPFYGEYVNVGTHAVVLDTILSNSFITPLPVYWSVLVSLLFVPLLIIGTDGCKSGLRALLEIVGVLLTLGIPFGLFVFKRYFIGPFGPALAMAAAALIREANAFVRTEHEKQFIRKAFSTYLSAGVVEEIIADPSKLNLGGEKREMTALFTDIQGFSTIAEKLDPAQLVQLLNAYLTVMSNCIMDNLGTIDKYEGDAIIAFFGAPVYREEHAALACRSALAMKAAEQELNTKLTAGHLSPSPLFTRMGINTGEMVVGNMGSENKMDYTIMGNAVNLASRLEGVNKQYRTGGILISEYTRAQTGDEFLCRRLDRVRVVGINEPLRLYELLAAVKNAGPEQRALAGIFDEALDCFESRNWKQAAEGFRSALSARAGDGPAQKYLDRCLEFLANPPPDAWDGVYNLTEK
ncbi:MAG: adenylate/guanylate cyclase domain-containing protein [Spirochaetaceae bacterium]|nr:adenylate/guanylate cyclase domain-containing protein [Spirochaetaceae bacterium]